MTEELPHIHYSEIARVQYTGSYVEWCKDPLNQYDHYQDAVANTQNRRIDELLAQLPGTGTRPVTEAERIRNRENDFQRTWFKLSKDRFLSEERAIDFLKDYGLAPDDDTAKAVLANTATGAQKKGTSFKLIPAELKTVQGYLLEPDPSSAHPKPTGRMAPAAFIGMLASTAGAMIGLSGYAVTEGTFDTPGWCLKVFESTTNIQSIEEACTPDVRKENNMDIEEIKNENGVIVSYKLNNRGEIEKNMKEDDQELYLNMFIGALTLGSFGATVGALRIDQKIAKMLNI